MFYSVTFAILSQSGNDNKFNSFKLISDDTQMTLFTANGILCGATRVSMRGIGGNPIDHSYFAYLDWRCTQTGKKPEYSRSWLLGIKELHARRAPGNTCMRALKSEVRGSVSNPINDSKGCGGVMRVAPVALYYKRSAPKPLGILGAEIAAITHGHQLGYMPAAALVHIIQRIVYGGCPLGDSLYSIIEECRDSMKELFTGKEHYSHVAFAS